jgi:hypothetical protein
MMITFGGKYSSRGQSVRSTFVIRRKVRRVAGTEAYTVQIMNIISQWLYFIARRLIYVFSLHSICVCFPSARKLVT